LRARGRKKGEWSRKLAKKVFEKKKNHPLGRREEKTAKKDKVLEKGASKNVPSQCRLIHEPTCQRDSGNEEKMARTFQKTKKNQRTQKDKSDSYQQKNRADAPSYLGGGGTRGGGKKFFSAST